MTGETTIRVELREFGTDELLETTLCGTQQAAEALGAVLVRRDKGKSYACIETVECPRCPAAGTCPACGTHWTGDAPAVAS